MLKLFKKSIWIPYEDSTVYPTVAKAQQAIIKYCEDNGFLYEFTADDEVVIDGIKHEIYRGYDSGSRGNYGIKCIHLSVYCTVCNFAQHQSLPCVKGGGTA